MTIVVYSGGECWSDDLVFSGDVVVSRAQKVAWRPKDGAIIGAAGSSAACSEFIRLAIKGQEKKFKAGESCTPIIFLKNGLIRSWSEGFMDEFEADSYAFGSGRDVALGALGAGASAKEAAEIACRIMGWPGCLYGVNHLGEWQKTIVYGPPQEKTMEKIYDRVGKNGGRTQQ